MNPRLTGLGMVAGFALLLAGFLTLSPPNAAAQSDKIPGMSLGAFKVDNGGAATYSIPIIVPPGINGVSPKLSLVYDSQGSNGLLGMGWSLSGLSSIHRCARTIAQDNFKGGINYDTNDRWCMDGSRLMVITPNKADGDDEAEYRTEIDSFVKVISYGSTGTPRSGPSYFIVRNKAGETLEFGRTADSQIQAQGKDHVQTWALNKITDASGNTITVTYEVDPTNGDFRPLQIDYPGNTSQNPCSIRCVKFVYEDRPDQIPTYVGGSLARTMKRLKNVQTYFGETLVRNYRLSYEVPFNTGRSRITSILECSNDACAPVPVLECDDEGHCVTVITFPCLGDGTCLPPHKFSWQGGGDGTFTSSPLPDGSSGWNNSQVWTGDFNNDGTMDILTQNNNKLITYLSQPSGTYAIVATTPKPSTWTSSNVRIGDFDGDGKQDLVYYNGPNFYYMFSRGDGTFTNPLVLNAPSGWSGANMWAGDFDGEGKQDLVSHNNGRLYFAFSRFVNAAGSFFSPTPAALDPSDGFNDTKAWVGDVNGDGKSDLITFSNNKLVTVFNISETSGAYDTRSSPVPTGWGDCLSTFLTCWAADFNADGLADVLSHSNGDGYLHYTFSKGDGTFDFSFAMPGVPRPAYWNAGKIWVFDANGDGKADLVTDSDVSGGFLITVFSNGDGTFWSRTASEPASWDRGHVWTGDFLRGDGKSDLVSHVGSQLTFARSNGPFPDLLTSITNSLGGTFNVVYKPLTDNTVYTRDSDAQYPIVDVQAPMYVVDNYIASNGTQNFQYTYDYGGAKSHFLGRGWLGFRFTRVQDESAKVEVTGQRRIVVTNQFRQVKLVNGTQAPDFPFIGMPSVSETADSSGTLFERVNNAYESKNTQPGVFLWSGDPRVQFASLKRVDKTEFDGQQTGFQKADQFEYDTLGPSGATLGNLTRTLHLGQVTSTTDTSFSGDEYDETAEFSFDPATWIQRPIHTKVNKLDPPPPNGTPTLLREKWLTYDTAGRLIKEESRGLSDAPGDPGGAKNPVVTHHYEPVFGKRDSTTDPLGCTTKTEAFDSTNTFPITVTKCFGASDPTVVHTTNFTWDARFGVKLTATDPNNVTTTFTYDNFGRAKTVVGPLDPPTLPAVIVDYLDWGDPAIQRIQTQTRKDHGGPDLITKSDYFDGLGRFDAVESTGPNTDAGQPRTIIHESVYDSRGLAVANTPVRFNTETALPQREQLYDVLGRLTRVDHPDNRFATTLFEPGKITLTDERLKQKIKLLDAYGRVKQIDEKNNNGADTYTTFYEYDRLGSLVHVQNHLGHHTRIKYDMLGRKEAMCDPNMGVGPNTSTCDTSTAGAWVYSYDNAGNLLTQTDAKANQITFDFDLRGRVKHKITTEGTITYKYDQGCTNGIGRLCEVDDLNNMVTTFAYTVEGRISQTQRTIDGTTYTMTQEYNALGGVTHETFPDFDDATYRYDEAGWLKAIDSYITQIKYNARGQKDEIDYANNVVTTFDYFDQDPPPPNQFINFALKTRFTTGPSGDLQNLSYKYDETGNVTNIIDALPGGTAGRDFGYDDLDRITLASGKFGALDPNTQLPTQIDNQAYAYDAIGNVLSKGTVTYQYCNHPLNPAPSSLCAGTIHPSAVVKTIDGATEKIYHYDNNGNTLDGAGRTFAWTSENRVISVTNGTGTTSMDYDYTGARIKKYGPLGLTIYPFPGYEVAPDGKKIKFFRAGGELVASKQSPTAGECMPTPEACKYFYHNDHLGGVNVITDGDASHNGARQQLTEYDPWGKVSRREGNVDPEHRFTGQILDPETDLYYYGARYYDPELARFVSPDPIVPEPANPQALNRYSYVINSPQNYIDPSGYSFWSWAKKIFYWHTLVTYYDVKAHSDPIGFAAYLNAPKQVKFYIRTADQIAATVAVSILTFGLATPLLTVTQGFLISAGIGAAAASLNGQNPLIGAAISAASFLVSAAIAGQTASAQTPVGEEGGSAAGLADGGTVRGASLKEYTIAEDFTTHPVVEGAKRVFVTGYRPGADLNGVHVFSSWDIAPEYNGLTIDRNTILVNPKYGYALHSFDKGQVTPEFHDFYRLLGHEFTRIVQARTYTLAFLRNMLFSGFRESLTLEARTAGYAFRNFMWSYPGH